MPDAVRVLRKLPGSSGDKSQDILLQSGREHVLSDT